MNRPICLDVFDPSSANVGVEIAQNVANNRAHAIAKTLLAASNGAPQ
jgi:hypothetical protein